MSYKIQTCIIATSAWVFLIWFFFFLWRGGSVIGISFPESGVGLVYSYMLSTDFPLLGCSYS